MSEIKNNNLEEEVIDNFDGNDPWDIADKLDDVKDEKKINSSIENSTLAINLELEKFNFGKKTIDKILKRQFGWMIFFVSLAFLFLFSSFIILIFLIINEASEAAVITAFIGVIIEIIALFSIMVKYTFSSQINELVKGIYNHNHFIHNNALDEQSQL